MQFFAVRLVPSPALEPGKSSRRKGGECGRGGDWGKCKRKKTEIIDIYR